MPRRVQDIVPNNHRSIRDIPVERNDIAAPVQPPHKKSGHAISLKKPDLDIKKREEKEQEISSESIKRISLTPPHKKKKNGSKRLLLAVMSIVIVVTGAGYVASVYFSRASFTIVPKTIPVNINGVYTVNIAGAKSAILTYELAAVKGSASAVVLATDGPNISTSAKGKITVYNSFSGQSQRLIAGTRFIDNTGRIYRLTGSIVVPGSSSSGGSIIPGSISAAVTADQPGPSYNIIKGDNTSDFKIVAYKGTPKYDSIYGHAGGDIVGGFIGVRKTINPVTLASTTAELQAKIITSLTEQIRNTLPDGYIMYRNAYVPSFSAPVIGDSDPKSASVTVQGTLYGILFKKNDLVTRVAGNQTISSFDGFAYETLGFESLDFSIANQKDFSPEKKNTLIIKLKGDALLVGSIPIKTLKGKLAGLSLADTTEVLRAYKPIIEIDKSYGEITPPWSKVPNNTDKIMIEVLTK